MRPCKPKVKHKEPFERTRRRARLRHGKGLRIDASEYSFGLAGRELAEGRYKVAPHCPSPYTLRGGGLFFGIRLPPGLPKSPFQVEVSQLLIIPRRPADG